jgi:hypothetical protein
LLRHVPRNLFIADFGRVIERRTLLAQPLRFLADFDKVLIVLRALEFLFGWCFHLLRLSFWHSVACFYP